MPFALEALTFESDTLRLRPFTSHDALSLFLLAHDEGFRSFDFVVRDKPADLGAVCSAISGMNESLWEHGFGTLAIEVKETSEIIGVVGLQKLPENDCLELFYRLCKDSWGKGFSRDAGQLCLVHAFRNLRAEKVFAMTHPENTRSKKTLENLGFSLIGKDVYYQTDVEKFCIHSNDFLIN